MSMQIGNEIKQTAGSMKKEITDLPEKPTKEGIASNFVGYVASVPVSFFYDWVYGLVAEKLITNVVAQDIIKIALPCAIGGVFQFGKIPFGNIVAGLGYGIGAISAIKILINRVKGGVKTVEKAPLIQATGATIATAISGWGVQ